MQKFIRIIEILVELLRTLFGKGPAKADTGSSNVQTLKTGLEMAPQTEKVKEARAKIEQIEALPPEERAKHDGEVARIEQIVQQEVKAKAPEIEKPAVKKSLLDKIREAEKARDAQRRGGQ